MGAGCPCEAEELAPDWGGLPESALAAVAAACCARGAARAACVCRRWRAAARSSAPLREELSLRGAGAPWRLALGCCLGGLRSLDLHFVPLRGAAGPLARSGALSSLRSLSLNSCSGLCARSCVAIAGACGPALRFCDLSGTGADEDAVDALGEATGGALTALSLRGCRAVGARREDGVGRSLEKRLLAALPGLIELLVARTQLDDTRVAHLHAKYAWVGAKG